MKIVALVVLILTLGSVVKAQDYTQEIYLTEMGHMTKGQLYEYYRQGKSQLKIGRTLNVIGLGFFLLAIIPSATEEGTAALATLSGISLGIGLPTAGAGKRKMNRASVYLSATDYRDFKQIIPEAPRMGVALAFKF